MVQVCKGMLFVGGESAAISRVYEYFWKKARNLQRLIYRSKVPIAYYDSNILNLSANNLFSGFAQGI